jgi:UDP-N-acetylmuramoyl-L-alanyl-D-glutamate--2,6-diaminopimelate ligase
MNNFIKKLFPNFIKVWYHKIRFLISNIKADKPNTKLKLIGVTGSSGKSTTAFMIYHILKESGKNVGLISTVGAYIDGNQIDIGLHVTTPDAHNIPKLLQRMVNDGCEYAVIEVSSHALSQGRLGNLKFDLSTITNITSDHLDWHKTWQRYAKSKSKIIDMTKPQGTVILNSDDEKGYRFIKKKLNNNRSLNVIDYSISLVQGLKSNTSQEFVFKDVRFIIPIIGSYNISNALAAIHITEKLGLTLNECSNALRNFETLKGHMEILRKENKSILLDFAHNTDSLKKSLIEARKLTKNGRLISLFGSAGLRDVKKRYDMGLEASKLSDIVIIVPEDPRTESLYDINSEIIRGCKDGNLDLIKRFDSKKDYISQKSNFVNTEKGVFSFDYEEVNARINGIELGISLLKKDDILITQGKGHEQSLCFGQKEYPYDEKSVILKLLNKPN